jgi:hypothetical protein
MADFSKRGDSYRHVDKDPIIDTLRTLAQEQGGQKLSHEYLTKLSYDSGISVTTLHAWFGGSTRRPQHLTVKFVLEALGCSMQIVRANGSIVGGRRSASVHKLERRAS